MKKFTLFLGLSLLLLIAAAPGFCDEGEDYGPGYCYGWRGGHMMGPGYGGGWGGGHMMGPGYGMQGRGWGMHGRGHMMGPGYGWGYGSRRSESMTPEQRKQWEKTWSDYRKDTLEIRKQLAAKQLELETYWDQPDVDQTKIEKLSNEIAELQAQLAKKHDKYLLQCRKQFGDQGWACPGGVW